MAAPARLAARGAKAAEKARSVVRARFLDFSGLDPAVRPLAGLGYGVVAVLLAAVVLLDQVGAGLPAVEYHDGATPVRVPAAALTGGAVAFALGWTFLLTGAGITGGMLRWAALALLGIEWLPLAAGSLVAPVPVLAAGIAGFPWGARPRRLFTATGLLLGAATVATALAAPARDLATILDGAMTVQFVVFFPFLFMLGLELADAGIQAAAWVSGRFTSRPGPLLAGTTLLLLTGAAVTANHGSVFAHWLAFAAVCATLLLGVGAALRLFRAWTPRRARLLLALLVAVLPLAFGLAQALQRQSALEAGRLPVALFAATFAWNTLNFGRRFAESDSPRLPRAARVLLYFGTVILLLAYAVLRMNVRTAAGAPVQEVQEIVNALFFAGVLVGGPLYLLWITWRRPESLLGS